MNQKKRITDCLSIVGNSWRSLERLHKITPGTKFLFIKIFHEKNLFEMKKKHTIIHTLIIIFFRTHP